MVHYHTNPVLPEVLTNSIGFGQVDLSLVLDRSLKQEKLKQSLKQMQYLGANSSTDEDVPLSLIHHSLITMSNIQRTSARAKSRKKKQN